MDIRWANVVAFGLALFGLFLGLKMHREIASVFSSMALIGPGHTMDEQVLGLISFTVVAACLLVLIRVLLQRDGDDR